MDDINEIRAKNPQFSEEEIYSHTAFNINMLSYYFLNDTSHDVYYVQNSNTFINYIYRNFKDNDDIFEIFIKKNSPPQLGLLSNYLNILETIKEVFHSNPQKALLGSKLNMEESIEKLENLLLEGLNRYL